MYRRINKCISLLLLVLLVSLAPQVTYAAEEKTPAPEVWINGGSISWDPAEYNADLKFRIYYKDKWSGESYQLVATCKGFDSENATGLRASFYFRDATNEEDPQIIKEKIDGHTYYSLPAISGRKYKVAVKTYDEKYGLWSDKATADYYFMSVPEVTVKPTKKGISVSWEPVIGVTKYYIDRIKLTRESDEQIFRIVGSDLEEFNDEDVIEGEVYLYEVRAGRGRWRSGAMIPDLIRVDFS